MFQRLRQKYSCTLKATLGYTSRLMPTWARVRHPVLKNNEQKDTDENTDEVKTHFWEEQVLPVSCRNHKAKL